jgi:hypothetical protein
LRGPHAKQWAYRERKEVAQLLTAQLDAEHDEQHHDEFDEQCDDSVSNALASSSRGAKAQTL